MQLILDSEPSLAVKKDMSAIEEIHSEKVGNGEIEQIDEKICNGNKENIGEVNIITNDDISKPALNEENGVSTDLPIDIKSQNTEVELSIGVAIKEEKCEVNNPETNGVQNEESQNNSTCEDHNNIDDIKQESETEKPDETAQEEVEEDEEDIIKIKHENFDDIPDTEEKETENVVSESNEPDVETIKEEIPTTKDDIEVIDEPGETQIESEAAPEVESEEKSPPVASTTANEDDQLKSSENKDKQLDDSNNSIETAACDSTEVITINNPSPIELKDDMDVDEVVELPKSSERDANSHEKVKSPSPVRNNIDTPIRKLSNTLDILSDDDEEPPKEEPPKVVDTNEKQCINIEDDDDIMLIDEDTSKTETPQPVDISNKEDAPIIADDKPESETVENTPIDNTDLFAKPEEKDSTPTAEIEDVSSKINISEKQDEKPVETLSPDLPLLPDSFLKTAKKNLADMTREDLEEFCILKIVESIVDRSNLSEIKNKLKTVAQGVDEYRKKTMMLTKQNRDLQVVLKSIQEEQKKMTPDTPITPLKITRSVGMQVFMEKSGGVRRKNLAQLQNSNNNNVASRQNAKSSPGVNTRPQKQPVANNSIPVPRLVPANSPAMKSPNTQPAVTQIAPKPAAAMPNGIKNPSSAQKLAEKRQHNRTMSVTVDLTDDEPPTKMNNRTSPAPPVRLVPPQNLMAAPRQGFPAAVSSPRKVYIPISGPQNQIRPGQTIMLKSVPSPGLRPRCPTPQMTRAPASAVRMNRVQTGRHPAPLPDAMKQYQPPNWKALPPAPDLKLSKVENGIVISWKIEGYQEDSYEEIASYQLYAYQETSSPPSTSLWKKIGDVKALPLPMACTLTQFMAGFKYFFAVRAVDIRSRLGPFSLPGSILLLNKL